MANLVELMLPLLMLREQNRDLRLHRGLCSLVSDRQVDIGSHYLRNSVVCFWGKVLSYIPLTKEDAGAFFRFKTLAYCTTHLVK